MTVNNHYTPKATRAPPTYLRLVEFFTADADFLNKDYYQLANKQPTSSTESLEQIILNNIENKFGQSSRTIGVRAYETWKRKFHDMHYNIQEILLNNEIEKLNFFTSFIDLTKIFHSIDLECYEMLNTKHKLAIDTDVWNILIENKEINQLNQAFSPIYPIQTVGDGNCLCHACLTYIVGMPDTNLCLRETLKVYMNEKSDELKERWFMQRQEFDRANKIKTEQKAIDKEWYEIVNMKHPENRTASNDDSSEKKSSCSPARLVYLEDVHIFALANLLKRPIIVIALETLKNIEPIRLRGIYLPVLCSVGTTIRDPIVIAFQNYHFVPLMFALDEMNVEKLMKTNDRRGDNECLITNSAESTLFENIGNINSLDEYHYLSQHFLKDEKSLCKFQFSRRNPKFYNMLPLQHSNQVPMRVHFLKPDEIKNEQKYLKSYLNLVELDDNGSTILGCFLNSSTELLKKNGITIYLDYLNETVKETKYSSSYATKDNANSTLLQNPSSSPSSNKVTFADNLSRKDLSASPTLDQVSLCKTDYCTQEAAKHCMGFCSQHLKEKLKQLEQESVEIRPKSPLYAQCSTPACKNICEISNASSTFSPYEKNYCETCKKKAKEATNSATYYYRQIPIQIMHENAARDKISAYNLNYNKSSDLLAYNGRNSAINFDYDDNTHKSRYLNEKESAYKNSNDLQQCLMCGEYFDANGYRTSIKGLCLNCFVAGRHYK